MNGNIVAVVLPDLNPVNQLGDHQMLGFVACIIKAAGPAQDHLQKGKKKAPRDATLNMQICYHFLQ